MQRQPRRSRPSTKRCIQNMPNRRKLNEESYCGVLTAIVTPFTAEGRLTCRRYASRCSASSPSNGIFCGGTNGEFLSSMRRRSPSPEPAWKRRPVARRWWPILGRFPPGRRAGWASRSPASELTRYRPLPVVRALKQEELINHYAAIADALSVPLFLYNIPARTGNTIAPETARQLARHENIVGIGIAPAARQPERLSRRGARYRRFRRSERTGLAYPSGIRRRLLGLHLGAC